MAPINNPTDGITDQTYLAAATIAGKYEIVQTLLKNNVSPDFKWAQFGSCGYEIEDIEDDRWRNSDYIGTPIHFAVYFGHYEIVRLLLEHNPNLDNENSIRLCDCQACKNAPAAVTAVHIAGAMGF